MGAETVLILPGLEPLRQVETPYGPAPVAELDGVLTLVRSESVEARALIWAAKELGARRVLAGEAVQAVSPLLEPGDLVIPADVIDLTKLRPFTFFVGKGYGFIKLNPPFCPDLMAALRAEARQVQTRSFTGATYVGAEGPRDASAAEVRMFRQWGGDVAGSGLLPETYLARELELHYAALTVVGDGSPALSRVLLAVAALPDLGRIQPCTCAESMAFMKQQGIVGEDWKQW